MPPKKSPPLSTDPNDGLGKTTSIQSVKSVGSMKSKSATGIIGNEGKGASLLSISSIPGGSSLAIHKKREKKSGNLAKVSPAPPDGKTPGKPTEGKSRAGGAKDGGSLSSVPSTTSMGTKKRMRIRKTPQNGGEVEEGSLHENSSVGSIASVGKVRRKAKQHPGSISSIRSPSAKTQSQEALSLRSMGSRRNVSRARSKGAVGATFSKPGSLRRVHSTGSLTKKRALGWSRSVMSLGSMASKRSKRSARSGKGAKGLRDLQTSPRLFKFGGEEDAENQRVWTCRCGDTDYNRRTMSILGTEFFLAILLMVLIILMISHKAEQKNGNSMTNTTAVIGTGFTKILNITTANQG